jgi:hypothetical protein
VRAHFFNSLKEATCIAHGSADRVMQLSPSSQSQLWQVRCVLAPHRAPVPCSWSVVPVLRCWGQTPCVTSQSWIEICSVDGACGVQSVQGGCDVDMYNRATETLPKLPGSSMR